jgi:transposase
MIPTTPTKRGRLIGLVQGGSSGRKAAAEIALPKSTGNDILRAWRDRGHAYPKTSPGRPPLLTERAKRHLHRQLNLHPFKSFIEFGTEFHVGANTISRFAASVGLFSSIARHGVVLDAEKAAARLQYAKDHENFDWGRVGFSDESAFRLGYRGVERVIRPRGKAWDPKYVIVDENTNSGSIMVWGMIAKGKKYPLVRMEYYDKDGKELFNRANRHPAETDIPHHWEERRRTVNGLVYQEQVLYHRLSRWLGDLATERGQVYSLEDNATVHNSHATNEVRLELGLERLPHPARSPDLNPIEHVWAIVKKAVLKRQRSGLLTLNSVEDLWVAMRDEWDAVPQETIDRIIDSMPARLEAVIAVNGWHTRY